MTISRKKVVSASLSFLFVLTGCRKDMESSRQGNIDVLSLSIHEATNLAELAINCIQVEYPNKPGHVMKDSSDVLSPRTLHPSFYGCYDWHSSVHGHWMLVKLLKKHPSLPQSETIRQMISANLSQENIHQEVAYLALPHQKSFERMYGWAWLLKLVLELNTWEETQAREWGQNLQPLADVIVERYLEFLPLQTYPVRTGLHSNTAFGLSFAWDYAEAMQLDTLMNLIAATGIRYYGQDRSCPGDWEPGGSDFLSPCLEEANLMRRILTADSFQVWLKGFFPDLAKAKPENLFRPALVADRSDPQIVHLDGLNLSRAWCMMGIASVIPRKNNWHNILVDAAHEHINAALPHIATGNYEGEHWLGSFAVYALSVREEISVE